MKQSPPNGRTRCWSFLSWNVRFEAILAPNAFAHFSRQCVGFCLMHHTNKSATHRGGVFLARYWRFPISIARRCPQTIPPEPNRERLRHGVAHEWCWSTSLGFGRRPGQTGPVLALRTRANMTDAVVAISFLPIGPLSSWQMLDFCGFRLNNPPGYRVDP